MIECPEARVLAEQINTCCLKKKILKVKANQSPHKFAWFHEEPEKYDKKLTEKFFEKAYTFGGLIEIALGTMRLVFSDGTNLLYHVSDAKRPKKHQLLIEFEDRSAISAAVQMYGGMWCFEEGTFKNPYYLIAKEKPSPFEADFDFPYFKDLFLEETMGKLSLKAFLATEQRIPGLGNGVLQDILYKAKLHPKRKMSSLSEEEYKVLFHAIKNILLEIYEKGGRDTEKDLFGQQGGYKTKMSRFTVGKACEICGSLIVKESYMGGSIYFCEGCQKV